MLAKLAATVDAISGGRLILGLGAGWNEREYTAFGFPYDKRISRFEEAFTIIRELLRTGRSNFRGAYYRVSDCVLDPRAVRPGGPPLLLGSVSPRMMRIGLPHVEAWNVWWSDYGNDAEEFAAVRARVERAAEHAGRAPGDVEATAAVLVQLPGGSGRLMGETYNDRTIQPVLVSELPERLHAMASAGAGHVQLVLDPITVESIDAVGEAVRTFQRQLT
jgi:alkanesulfonate monooxygenase SsuD/methylene tetrahydromethanopterin reductase-like flavin-dependent oxidoreductase (luciferase family)